MDEFESPALEALPFEEINDDCPPTPESSDSSDVVSTENTSYPYVSRKLGTYNTVFFFFCFI